MKRFELSRLLANELGGDFVVVPSPDHPELISGPDVLIGGRGRITAAFRIGRFTQQALLGARVIATRLALPVGSSLVAVVERDVEPPRHLTEHGFDVLLLDSQTRDLIRLCTKGQPERRHIDDLRRVQQQHAKFYSTILQIAELRQRHELKASSVREVVATLRRREPIVNEPPRKDGSTVVADKVADTAGRREASRRESDFYSARATVRQTTVAALPDYKQRSIALRLRPLWSEALLEDFVLDMGVPYQRVLLPRVLLVEAWPIHRFDPRKPARAAAFSSWLMAIATTADDIEMLIDRSLEITWKRLHA